MASNLRVDSIVPATGSSVSIGTATGGVNIPGVLTYEDVTNVDSVGVITARSGINVSGGGVDITTGGLVVTGISTTTARLDVGNNGTNAVDLRFRSNRASAGQTIANLNYEWNGTTVAQIRGIAGSDTTNKDDGHLAFYTTPAGSGSFSERLRIGSAGQLGIAGANYGTSGQVLTSQGSGSAPTWASASNPTLAHAFVFMDSQYFTSTPTKMGFNSSTTNDQSSGVTIDRTNKRFTPTVGGVYQVVTSLNFDRGSGGSSIEYKVFQYKNGSEFARNTSFQYSTGITDSLTCHSLMSLNGSGDYVEFYARHNASGNAIMNVQSTFFIIRVGA